MSGPNAELAYATLDYIDAHPEDWKQETWACGTAACFAGWAIRLSGGEVHRTSSSAVVVTGPENLAGMEVEYAAYEVLGLDEERHGSLADEWLFDPVNNREDLGRIVADIFGPRPCPNCPPGYDCERGHYATEPAS